jgi:modulator of FtsH protease
MSNFSYGQADITLTKMLVSADQRNRVLRNTYWLLALSLIPTILGTWTGLTLGLAAKMHGMLAFLILMAGAFGLMFAVQKYKNSALGVVLLLAFTFFMGLMLTPVVQLTLNYSNGPTILMTAFAGTAGVFLCMATMATVIKRDLSGIGKWLFVGVIVLVVASLINVFIASSAAMLAISVLSIGIFSALLLYDIKRIIDGGETNYISATLSIYLDMINIFQNLLMLLGFATGRRD